MELQDLSDQVYARTRARLEGLSDEEYLWEPAPGCWTIRPRSERGWAADWPLPRPEVEPFTTLAWRLWHLIDMYGEDRAPRWLDVPAQGEPIGMDAEGGAPAPSAAEAISMLERAHERWDAHLSLVTDDRLAEPVGAVAGPEYAERSRAQYVLHMLDEFIHHGAEIALLRDLWRWQHAVSDDAVAERIMRGDAGVIEVLGPAATAEQVDLAARYGRWDLVTGLIDRGADLPSTGTTLLHRAAGAGEVALVEQLLERGADPTALDPQFRATPRQWAMFLRQGAVVDVLDRRTGSAE